MIDHIHGIIDSDENAAQSTYDILMSGLRNLPRERSWGSFSLTRITPLLYFGAHGNSTPLSEESAVAVDVDTPVKEPAIA